MRSKNRKYFGKIHLFNKKFYFFLSSVIITIGMIVMLDVLVVYYSSNYTAIRFLRFFGDSQSGMYKVKTLYMAEDFDYYENYKHALLELRENYNIAVYDVTGIRPREMMSRVSPLLFEHFSPEEMFRYGPCIPLLKIDDALVKAGKIKNEDGDILTLKIGSDKVAEAAVGQIYKGTINIGETFSDLNGQQYRVVCFLAENQRWSSGRFSDSGSLTSLDNYFVAPINLDNYNDRDQIVYVDNVYFFPEGDISRQIAEVEEYAEKEGLFFDIIPFKEYLYSLVGNNKDAHSFTMVLAALIFIAAIGAMLIISTVMWLADVRDIGILYTNGFTSKDIFLIMLHENLQKLTAPFIFMAAYTFVKIRHTSIFAGIGKMYMVEMLAIVCASYLAAAVVCSFVTYLCIKGRTTIGLLKGETV